MKISLGEALASKTQRVDFDYTVDLSGEEIDLEHPFLSPVRLHGYLDVQGGINRLEAEIDAHVTRGCARCLEPVEYDKKVPVSFILTRKVDSEELDDIIYVESDEVELDELLVPELFLDLETVVLCREDCKGLCPKCGKNLNYGDCGCDRREIDPRLAKLQELLKKD